MLCAWSSWSIDPVGLERSGRVLLLLGSLHASVGDGCTYRAKRLLKSGREQVSSKYKEVEISGIIGLQEAELVSDASKTGCFVTHLLLQLRS